MKKETLVDINRAQVLGCTSYHQVVSKPHDEWNREQ